MRLLMIARRKPVSSLKSCSGASHPNRTSSHSDNSTVFLLPSMTERILRRQIDWTGNFSSTKCCSMRPDRKRRSQLPAHRSRRTLLRLDTFRRRHRAKSLRTASPDTDLHR